MVPYVLLVPLAAATLAASSHVPLPPASSTYNFLALADWGDDGAGQHAAAVGLGTIAASINAQSVYVLGDNFYSNGIRPEDGRDGMTRINRTFESVYTADSLRNIPFHVVAGNHDHNGNVSAQFAYTNNAQNVNGRWRFPYVSKRGERP